MLKNIYTGVNGRMRGMVGKKSTFNRDGKMDDLTFFVMIIGIFIMISVIKFAIF